MYTYLITYRTGYYQEYLVEMPSLWKLLLWVFRNAANCHSFHVSKAWK